MVVQQELKTVIAVVLSAIRQKTTKYFYFFLFILLFSFVNPNFIQSSNLNFTAKLIKIIQKNDEGEKLSVPSVVYFNENEQEIYIIDSPRERIILYNSNFFPFFSVGRGRGILTPVAIASCNNYIYVCQAKGPHNNIPKITIYSSSWFEKKDIKINDFKGYSSFNPKSVAVSESGKIYIIGNGIKGVIVLNKNGNYIKTVKLKDSLEKDIPPANITFSDIFIDKKGRIYLLSEETGKAYILSSKEKLLFKAGIKGGTPGKLSRPRGISASSEENFIFIVDYMRHIVQVLDYRNGDYLFEFGGFGNAPGFFNYPTDVTVDNNGYVYVADMFNKRVQVFKIIKKIKKEK